jgi:hypothetical protein
MSSPVFHKWVQLPVGEMHYYKTTEGGTLHVNVTKNVVNALIPNKIPSLAEPCQLEEFNQAITQVWNIFNSI